MKVYPSFLCKDMSVKVHFDVENPRIVICLVYLNMTHFFQKFFTLRGRIFLPIQNASKQFVNQEF